MLDNFAFGQYYPGTSVFHRMDPRMKIILLILYIAGIFYAGTLPSFAVPLLFMVFSIHMAAVPLKMVFKSLKPLRYILIFTFVLNLFFLQGERVLLDLGFARITREGLVNAVLYALRLVFLVMGSSLLTLTTAPVPLTDGLERLLSPLKAIRFPAHEMAMMMTIALRFIPTLLEETDKIMKAQSARGADFESGNLIQRAKAMVPLLVPLFVSSFRRAGELAMAMEARCYHGGEGRTRLHVLKMARRDYIALALGIVMVALTVALSRLTAGLI